MNIGLILVCVGFAIEYIVFQLVPFFYFLSVFDKDERKEMSCNDWMFMPLIALLLLTPVVGMIIGLLFLDEEKWLQRFAMIGIYIIIIGFVIAMITN